MTETVIFLLAFLGVFLAGLVNHARWKRRFTRSRQHWTDHMQKVRAEYEVILANQDKSFSQQKQDFQRREQLMGQKIIEYSKKLRVLSAANAELWKKVNPDA